MRSIIGAIGGIGSQDWRNLVLIAVVGAMLGLQHFLAIDRHDLAYSLGLHDRILDGTPASPYRYRILVPALLEGLARVSSPGEPRETALLRSLALYDVVGLTLLLVALYALVRQWFASTHSLVAVLFAAGVAPIGFSYFRYHPWWIMEVALLAVGLLCAYRGKFLLLGVLVVLAALNRETGIFLPLAVLLAQLGSLRLSGVREALKRRETIFAMLYVCLSAGVFLGLRLLRGLAGPADQLDEVIVRNLAPENLARAAYAVSLFLGAGWVFAALGWRSAPLFLRRASRVVPLYLAVFAVWGWWREVRILATLYPLLVPLVLAYCARSEDQPTSKAKQPSS